MFETTCDISETVETLHKRMEKLKRENLELNKQVMDLEAQMKTLMGGKDRLVLGQVACEVDRKVPEIALNLRVGAGHYEQSTKDMKWALQGNGNFIDL